MHQVVEGVILNYRIGRKTQRLRECLIRPLNLNEKEAGALIGWWVGWPAERPKVKGKVLSLHGRRGVLRVRFERGVPGQALGSKVKIYR